MDGTVKALKNLYVALGGNLTDTHEGIADGIAVSDYSLIPDMINALAQLEIPAVLPSVEGTDEGKALMVSGEGKWVAGTIPSQLPAVTADDNGDVLTVVEGVWTNATPE